MSNTILTVSQLNYSVRQLLEFELGQIWLTGEISNFTQPASGHWYLTLKDEQAQVRCAMFRMKNQSVRFHPQNGMQILARANVSLYEPRGDYQLILESMQPAGDGLLQQQFEQLKMALAAEGLFAQSHKKAIPSFAKTIGIITSPSGAALQDILNILKRRDPALNVIIYPTLVQGKEATQDIVQMIQLANRRKECDLLIIGRGGGSLEDLWCFNEEAVARAVYASDIPIISAVGHETDVTIIDFVADLRAPTPSAAAELASRDQTELHKQLYHQFEKANLAFDRLWLEKTTRFAQLTLRLNQQHPKRQIQQQLQQLQQLTQRLNRAIQNNQFSQQRKLAQLAQRLNAQHPQRHLQRQQQQLRFWQQRLIQQIEQIFSAKTQRWQQLSQRLERNPLPHQIESLTQRYQQINQKMGYAINKYLLLEKQKLQQLCTKLDSISPLKVLSRGYSITENAQQQVITASTQLTVGEKIQTRFEQGSVTSQIIKITPQ